MLKTYLHKQTDARVISYMTVRKAIGVLGIALPFMLLVGMWIKGCGTFPDSISNYYFTQMGTVLSGVLCVVGVFLFAYKGYTKLDSVVSNLAGLFALCIALFPNQVDFKQPNCFVVMVESSELVMYVHFITSALFLLTLSYMSITLFTKTDPSKTLTVQKKKRNVVYRVCGWTMFASVVILAGYFVYTSFIKKGFKIPMFIFVFEAIALIAFGISWLTKGEAIFPDPGKGKRNKTGA